MLLVVWARYGILILYTLNLTSWLFGMEFASGIEKSLMLGAEMIPFVSTVIKMGKPDDLTALQKKL